MQPLNVFNLVLRVVDSGCLVGSVIHAEDPLGPGGKVLQIAVKRVT